MEKHSCIAKEIVMEQEYSQDRLIMERGLLDLSVTLSTRDLTAGNQFAIFVLVKNPFDKPVWIRQVHVSLPSELRLASAKITEDQKRELENEQRIKKLQEDQQFKIEHKIELLQKELIKISTDLNSREDATQSTERLIRQIEIKIDDFQEELNTLKGSSLTNISLKNANISSFQIVSMKTNLSVGGKEEQVNIGDLSIYDPQSFQEQYAQARKIEMESSLPRNTALQPGSTVVYTAVLYVEKSLIFTPSIYRLHFNVNYSFHPKDINYKNSEGEKGLFANTIAHEISIRPSVYSVLYGSILGGFIGAIARFLQVTPVATWKNFTYVDSLSNLVTLLVSVILSGIAIIFMVRKSDTQSFISVEDFWGGLLIGFLVGYTGASFFQDLTGITNPTLQN